MLKQVPRSLDFGMAVRALEVEAGNPAGRLLFARAAEVSGPPASLLKLATAAAALEILGPDYRFRTIMAHRPESVVIDSLTGRRFLADTLFVQAGGDPCLAPEGLDELAVLLWRSGLDSLVGPVALNRDRFDHRRRGPGWMWDDGPGAWAARVSAATVNGNCLSLRNDCGDWSIPGSALMRIRVLRTGPECSVLGLQRNWRAERDDFLLYQPRRSAPLAADSLNPPRSWIRPGIGPVNVEYPDSLYRSMLYESLSTAFGKHAPPVLDGPPPPEDAAIRFELLSPPLQQILDTCLTGSWNLGAECVFQELVAGQDSMGRSTWERASGTMHSFLCDSLGLPGSLRAVDGSGISRYNALSMDQVCRILVRSEVRLLGSLRDLLPFAGEEGTLADGFQDLPLGVTVRAKSGTLTGRRTLAGYMEVRGRPRLAFALNLSGHPSGTESVSAVRDGIIRELAHWAERKYR